MHIGIGSLNGGALIISRRRSMMASLRDQNESIRAKLEGDDSNTDNISKGLIAAHASASSSLTIGTSRQWSGFKNPRIVRVSRTFGGKDRHSKVCTIRGLRDRRIRLSVPTAIQLYDLQERLGLNQPSKVIDWLIEATKLDIDELPPLHFPPGDFSQFHGHHSLIGQLANNHAPPHHFTPYLDANLTLMNSHPTYNSSSSMMLSHKEEGININDDLDDEDGNEEDEHLLEARLEKIKWNNKAGNSEQDQYQGQGIGCDGNSSAQVSAQSFLSPMGGSGGFLPSSMNSSSMLPYGNFYHWEPSNLSLSQYGSHGFLAPSEESNHLTSSSYPGGGNNAQHLFYCPPSMPTTTASLFPQDDNRFRSSTSAGVNQLNDKGDN